MNISPDNPQIKKLINVLFEAGNFKFLDLKYFLEHEDELMRLIKKYEHKFSPEQIDIINNSLCEINKLLHGNKEANNTNCSSHSYNEPVSQNCMPNNNETVQDDSIVYYIFFILIVISLVAAVISKKNRY